MLENASRPTVYVETSVISYLSALPSRDVVQAGHQQTTRDWWESREGFVLQTSQLVLDEAQVGDATAAARRLAALAGLELLEITDAAVGLAEEIVREGIITESAGADALHVAVAVTAGCDYLVSWNYRHMVNAALRARIEGFCRARGLEPAVICTPEELMEVRVMREDPIVAEVREARRQIMERHGNNLRSLFHELKAHEARSGKPLVKGVTRPSVSGGGVME